MREQPIPEKSRCPNCGEKPTDESVVEHRLSSMGYTHDDIRLECQNCSERWTHGVPIGTETEFGEDLLCDSCGSPMLVHRIRIKDNLQAKLDVKCPECKYFNTLQREGRAHEVDGDVYLIGYPQIVGEIEDAENYGY